MEAPIFVRSKIAIPFSIGLASDHVKDHVNNPQTCHHSPTATLPFCQKSSWFPNNFPGWMSNKSQFVVGSIPQKPNVLQWNPMTSSPFLRGKSNPKAPVSDVKSQEIPTTKPFPTNGVAGHHWPLRHEGPWWYLPWKMVLELGEPHIFFSDLVLIIIDLCWSVWLVVWNIFVFSIYWESHHPKWLSYFSEGLRGRSAASWLANKV